jgi:hypothetical protein
MHRARPHRHFAHRDAWHSDLRCADLLTLYMRGSTLAKMARTSPPQRPTSMASYAAVIACALDARGVSSEHVFAMAGIERKPHNDPLDRIPVQSIAALHDAAVASTNDPYFGLYAADFVHVTTFHAFGYTLLASCSLRDFCERVATHFRFAAQSVVPRFDAKGARLEFARVAEVPALTDDIVGLFLVRLISELSRHRVRPDAIALHRPAPPDDGVRHTRAFGCPVRFGSPNTTFYFDPSLLDVPFIGASRELADHNEKFLIAHAALYALANGDPNDSGMSMTEIAYVLGFADRLRFSTALRCWSVEIPHRDHRARPRRLSS